VLDSVWIPHQVYLCGRCLLFFVPDFDVVYLCCASGDYFHSYIYILRFTIYNVVSFEMQKQKKDFERTLLIRAVLTKNKLCKLESLRQRFLGVDAFDEIVLFHKVVVEAQKRDFGKFVSEVQSE